MGKRTKDPSWSIASLVKLFFYVFAFCFIAHYFINIWDACGNFFQNHWNNLVDYFGEDMFHYRFYGMTIISFSVFWGYGSLYIFMDLTNQPKALRKYKVQPGANEPLDMDKFKKMISQVLFNSIVLNTFFIYLTSFIIVNDDLRKLPNIFKIAFQIFGMVIIEEFGFYYGHRLFHSKLIYRHIHKKHHEWTAPIAWAAIYAHPIEHIVCNLLPLGLGPILIKQHIVTTWIYFTLAIMFTLNEHSGYHLPFTPSPEAHDFHHFKFNQCYGVLGLLDTLHGTNKQFVASKGYLRHKILFGLKSAREVIP